MNWASSSPHHEIPDMPTATAEAMARVREISREQVARGGGGRHIPGWGLGRLMGGCGQARSTCSPPARAWEDGLRPFMAVNAAKQGVPVCVYNGGCRGEQLIFRMRRTDAGRR